MRPRHRPRLPDWLVLVAFVLVTAAPVTVVVLWMVEPGLTEKEISRDCRCATCACAEPCECGINNEETNERLESLERLPM